MHVRTIVLAIALLGCEASKDSERDVGETGDLIEIAQLPPIEIGLGYQHFGAVLPTFADPTQIAREQCVIGRVEALAITIGPEAVSMRVTTHIETLKPGESALDEIPEWLTLLLGEQGRADLVGFAQPDEATKITVSVLTAEGELFKLLNPRWIGSQEHNCGGHYVSAVFTATAAISIVKEQNGEFTSRDYHLGGDRDSLQTLVGAGICRGSDGSACEARRDAFFNEIVLNKGERPTSLQDLKLWRRAAWHLKPNSETAGGG